MMTENSSMDELITALGSLGGDIYTGENRGEINEKHLSSYIGDYWPNGADRACLAGQNIAKSFEGVNANLYQSWEAAAEFFSKIGRKLHEDVAELAEQMLSFANQSIENEKTASKAVNEAVSASEEILSELGIE